MKWQMHWRISHQFFLVIIFDVPIAFIIYVDTIIKIKLSSNVNIQYSIRMQRTSRSRSRRSLVSVTLAVCVFNCSFIQEAARLWNAARRIQNSGIRRVPDDDTCLLSAPRINLLYKVDCSRPLVHQHLLPPRQRAACLTNYE